MRRSRRGSSLVEVMIVLVLLIVMLTVVYGVIDGMLRARGALAESDGSARSARVTLDRLRREIQLAYLTPHTEAVNSYQTVFVGTDDNPDKLYFATLAHQRLYRDSRECDQAEITVWTEDLADQEGPGTALFHRESARVDEKPAEDGIILPLATNVKTFNLRYLDSETNEWRDEWDTRVTETMQRLPRAIEIGLVLLEEQTDPATGRRDTVEIPLLTTVVLSFAKEMRREGVVDGYAEQDPNNPAQTPGVPPMPSTGMPRAGFPTGFQGLPGGLNGMPGLPR